MQYCSISPDYNAIFCQTDLESLNYSPDIDKSLQLNYGIKLRLNVPLTDQNKDSIP